MRDHWCAGAFLVPNTARAAQAVAQAMLPRGPERPCGGGRCDGAMPGEGDAQAALSPPRNRRAAGSGQPTCPVLAPPCRPRG